MTAMDPKYEYEVAATIYPEPLSLFEKDPDWKPYPLYDYRMAVSGAAAFALTRITAMYYNRRPIYSGLHRTALWMLGGIAVGQAIQICMDRYIKFRSQVHRHYLMLHPERFPPPKKEKIGDKFDLWMPSRN